jgi:hypothetical protein
MIVANAAPATQRLHGQARPRPTLWIVPRADGEISRVFRQKMLYIEAEGAISST